ncbi:MAG: metal ABC transporter permease [Actinomycetes bacterium]
MGSLLANAGWQSNWTTVLGAPFMRNALIAGMLVAVAAGLLGYFVVVRQGEFAAHALGHIGFPGATGAVLIGVSPLIGLGAFCIIGAVVIGLLGSRASERATATGTVLAFSTALGVLFASLGTRGSSTITNVLFGNLLAVTNTQLAWFAACTIGVAVVVAAIGRPLVLASVAPDIADARGLPVTALGMVFLVLMSLLVTMAVQAVGSLLLFALVVTPPATALRWTARPVGVGLISSTIGLTSVGLGLTLSAMFNLPPSFFIVATAVLVWIITLAATANRVPAAPVHHDHHC